MHRSFIGLVALSGLFLISSASLGAESHAKSGVVFLNDVPVLELKSGSPTAQAAGIVKALRLASDDDVVSVKTAGSDSQIWVGSGNVLSVTPEEAVEHKCTVAHLSDTWASTIRDALALPPLKFSTDFLREPLASANRAVTLVGSLAYGATVSSSNEAVVKVTRTDSGFNVNCVGVGDALIKAVNGNSERTLAASVRAYAGLFPQSITVEVSGNPASAATVLGAVEGAVKARIVSLPTATCSFVPPAVPELASGKSVVYTVWTHLRAAEAFDNAGNVLVTVRNVPVPRAADTALWYSNAPESVHQVGPLFSSFLEQGTPIRFLYHHVDASTQPMILRVEAINDSDEIARLFIIPGDSKPDKNPVRAGMTAARQFIDGWMSE